MRLSYVILTALLVVLISGCNSYELESDRWDRDVTIDGDDNEWDESRFYIEKEGIVAGVMNDDEFLYVCIYPSNSQLSGKILRQGLTLWANAEGKKEELRDQVPTSDSYGGFQKDSGNDDPEGRQGKKFETPEELEIIGPEENKIAHYYTSEISGLQLGLNMNKGVLVYEIKIPFKSNPSNTFSLNAKNGDMIALGFEIEKAESDLSQMGPKEGSRSGGMGSGMKGQRSSHGDKPDTSAEEFWLKINLAEN